MSLKRFFEWFLLAECWFRQKFRFWPILLVKSFDFFLDKSFDFFTLLNFRIILKNLGNGLCIEKKRSLLSSLAQPKV